MKMHISRDALRRRIQQDGDLDIDGAGSGFSEKILKLFINNSGENTSISEGSDITELKHAFGTLIHQLRRDKGIDIGTLSTKINIHQEELCSIENKQDFEPKPRTVFKLAEYFNLNASNLMRLSGATITHDKPLHDAAVKFAARSDDLSKLSKEEREILNEFVKFLSK